MSESLENNYSEPCERNLVMSRTGILAGEDLTVYKSGTFDAEFDLLESTLSELKDGEHESASSKPSCNDPIIKDHSEINISSSNNSHNSSTAQDSESLKAVSRVTSCNSCQDTCYNKPDSVHEYSLPTTQHSKSVYYKEDTVINLNNSEDVFCHSDSGETKSEITNSCSIEAVNKPVLLIDFDQSSNTSDKKECDRQHSLSLKSLEVIDKDPKCSVSLGLRGGELSQANKHSVKGCDLDTVANKSPISLTSKPEEPNLESFTNLCEASVNSVNNCENSSEIAITMGDAVITSVSSHLDGSDNDLNTLENSETDGSKVDSEVPQTEDPGGNDKYEHQEKTIEIKEEECFKSLDFDKTTPKKLNCETETSVKLQVCTEDLNGEPIKKQGIFFSTPNMTRKLQENLNNQSSDAPDFGLVSPLDVKCLKGKQNLKRKYIGLQPIEEVDEDTDTMTEKKIKVDDETDTVVNSATHSEAGTSSTHPCYEAPARSLLKKWQPSCLSRNVSSTSFIVLDECGETEFEDCPKLSQEYDSSRVDDFEIACQSLTEELMKSSSNIETLEKYHSQVQLENQMDDEKFDEILKELTMNVDLDDNTCLSLRSMDESTLNESDKTSHILKAEKSVDTVLPSTESKGKLDNEGSLSDNDNTIIEGNNHIPISGDLSIGDKNVESKNIEHIAETQKSTTGNVSEASELKPIKDELNASDEEILDIDEEDFLLEENVNTKDKPYEFFEYVSTDPKENEDNYNPEWQKLGRLTSDEERYKAVRDRWRSLVPPNPNRNLTYRQWRTRNNKSPIKLVSLNNNHQLMDDNEKNQLCTAVFDNKIKNIVQDLEDSRMNIYRQRNREFEELGRAQDAEQMRASMMGFNDRELAQLHSSHLNQCRVVKSQYDQELKRIQDITEEKIRILRDASKEVLLFQKFYKGVGARDDNEMYMTDIQVQELMETEEMLEQYKLLYK